NMLYHSLLAYLAAFFLLLNMEVWYCGGASHVDDWKCGTYIYDLTFQYQETREQNRSEHPWRERMTGGRESARFGLLDNRNREP
ncbi:hypothetical protein MKZ38_000739, partial [Zalerion maritima]